MTCRREGEPARPCSAQRAALDLGSSTTLQAAELLSIPARGLVGAGPPRHPMGCSSSRAGQANLLINTARKAANSTAHSPGVLFWEGLTPDERSAEGPSQPGCSTQRAGEPCGKELQPLGVLLLLGPILSAALSFSSAHSYLRA